MDPQQHTEVTEKAASPEEKRFSIRLPHIALVCALIVILGVLGISLLSAETAASEAQTQAAAAALALQEPFNSVSLEARSAYVLDATTGAVLFHKNEEMPLALASITKLMLAVVVSEVLSPDDKIAITATSLAEEGESSLVLGEVWRMQDLLDFTLIISSNDGAQALAEAAAPIIRARHADAPNDSPAAATVWLMNEKAKELGLAHTYFLGTNGLDASEEMAGAYGSSKDIALLMHYALTHHADAISETTRDELPVYSTSGGEHTAYNTNGALGELPGLIAGKTGFTDIAGGNLVVAFDASIGRPVIVVVLGSSKEGRFADVSALAQAAREALGR